ncbi:MAG: hypothetical protein VKK59_01790 [Vampirovibrionales bacterium]|nr:hypothetical protein [Vampirovibrionales bacterium]
MSLSTPPPVQSRNFFTWFCAGNSYLNEPAYAEAVAQQKSQARVSRDVEAVAKWSEQLQVAQNLSEQMHRSDSRSVLEETTPYNFIVRPFRLALRRVTVSMRRLILRAQEQINKDQRLSQIFRSAEVMWAFPGVISRVVGNLMSYFFWRHPADNASKQQAQQRDEFSRNDDDNFSLNPLVVSSAQAQGRSS